MTENIGLAKEGKYLTFNLGKEEFGIEILKVIEIIGLMKITTVPRTPEFVRGIINLRGTIHPVINLRLKFGMESIEDTEETCIIVVEIEKGEEIEQIGVVVDAVKEVLDVPGNCIEPAPELGQNVNTKFIMGMAKIKNEVKILLNVQKIFAETDLSQLTSVSES